MVLDKLPKINPPSGRVPGQVLLAIRISGSRWRRKNGENLVMEDLSRVFGMRGKYRRKGVPGGPPDQAVRWCDPTPGRARHPPGEGDTPLGVLWASRVF